MFFLTFVALENYVTLAHLKRYFCSVPTDTMTFIELKESRKFKRCSAEVILKHNVLYSVERFALVLYQSRIVIRFLVIIYIS